MAVPSTNTSMADIQTEFGGSNPISLSEYYSGGPLVPAGAPAPNGPIPSSGQISIGQFRGSENITFLSASGGTETTSGDYKIHTFTGPGTFTVNSVGNQPTGDKVDYLVLAGGGGGGGRETGGGGGAGGFRESQDPAVSGPYTASPLATPSSLPVSAQGYPITVGGGGSGNQNNGSKGSNSVFSSITSTGGGYGTVFGDGGPGVSGGGGGRNAPGNSGSGNSPSVSPSQGNPGGRRFPFPFQAVGPPNGGGGGGGATGSGGNAGPGGGPGGSGATTSINGSPVTRAGGGGGGSEGGSAGSGGPGGGVSGRTGPVSPIPGAASNTGAGGGGNGWGPGFSPPGGNGGSGLVIIRYKYQ